MTDTIKEIMNKLREIGRFKTPEEVDKFFEESLNRVYQEGLNHTK